MDIFVSSGAFGATELPDMFDRARDWGVSRIELTAGMKPVNNPLGVLRAQSDLQFLIHNYFPSPRDPFVLNLASEDAETLARSRAHCKAAIRLSGALGARVFSVHAGFAARVRPEHLGRGIPAELRTDRGRADQIFVESIRGLIPHAVEAGVQICVENNVVEPANLIDGRNEMLLLATAAELTEFVQAIDHPAVGLLIDVGHVNVTSRSLNLDRCQFLAKIAPYTSMLHLSDNDGTGDTNGSFDETAWFIPELGRFDCSVAVIEAYRLTREKLDTCVAAVRAVNENI